MLPRSSRPVAGESLTRRAARASRWLVPAFVYALIPKCPVCLAAYLALFTGAAVPIATAQTIRTGLIVFCVASIVTLVGLKLRHRGHRHRAALTRSEAAS